MNNNEQRFFLDHGIIHDRATGRHVHSQLGEGPAFDALVHETLAELNKLARAALTAATEQS